MICFIWVIDNKTMTLDTVSLGPQALIRASGSIALFQSITFLPGHVSIHECRALAFRLRE